MRDRQAQFWARIATILAMVALWLFLVLYTFGKPEEEEEEGVEVLFVVPEAMQTQPAPAAPKSGSEEAVKPEQGVAPEKVESSAPEKSPEATGEKVMTAEEEEALRIEEARKEAARQRAEAKRKKEEEARAKAAAMGDRVGHVASTVTDGKGTGNAASGDGLSYSLAGRKAKSLATPGNNFSQSGDVVVAIVVDETGRVVDARITSGTNISNQDMINLALEAARKTVFNESEASRQTGTITYHFKQN